MFIYFFAFILIFFNTDVTYIFIYMYIIYTLVYIKFNNFFLFLSQSNIFINIKQPKIQIKKLLLLLQTTFKYYKCNLRWKPLFKKISYFGFFRNNINNILNKK